jgi:sugar O-acyltransferase (sialic acid O-acetyltransferase NeuD family)
VTRLLILGAGSFALDVLEAVQAAGLYEAAGFVVSDAEFLGDPMHAGLPVCELARLHWAPDDVRCIAGITSPARRPFLAEMRRRGFTFVPAVHPAAIVSPSATIGAGSFVGAGAIVGARASVGEDALVNRGANLGHDVVIGACATIGPGAILAGGVEVGAAAFIGVGAVVSDHVSIGEHAIVAAGSVVIKPVSARVFVAGSPARAVRSTSV